MPDYSALFKLMIEKHTILDATMATYKKWVTQDPSKQFYYEACKRMTAEAYRAGVTICTGTDDDQEGFVQNEMHLLVNEAGFSPIDALIAATKNGAELLGISNRLGTIESNKVADLVILDKNPLENLDNLGKVYLVIKHGGLYKKKN